MDPLSLEFSFFPHDWDRGGLAWISETFLFYVHQGNRVFRICYFFRKIFFLWWKAGGMGESFDIAHEREFAAFNNFPPLLQKFGKIETWISRPFIDRWKLLISHADVRHWHYSIDEISRGKLVKCLPNYSFAIFLKICICYRLDLENRDRK